MYKQRIAWSIILAGLLINMVLSESIAGIYLFLGAFLVPLLSVLVTAWGIKRVEIKMILPKTCNKRESIKGSIEVSSGGLLPVLRGEVQVGIRNILTAEENIETLITGFSKQSEHYGFILENQYCGLVEVKVDKIAVYDPFRLWRKELYPDAGTTLMVLPDTFSLELELIRGNMANQDSIEYAQGKIGNDPSEIFAIREYQEGDSIRNIHWKLSSKCDNIMVKLPSLPLENSLLMLLETDLHDGEDVHPGVFDTLAEIYITISQTLIDNEISHKLGWFDHKENRMLIYAVNDEEELHGIMGKFLSTERSVAHGNAVERYMDEAGHFNQAHLVYVTHRNDGCLEQIPVEMIRTAVVCSETDAMTSAAYDYTCTPEDYKIQLRRMTI